MTAKQGNLDITKGPLKLSVFFAKVNSGSLAYGSECCIPAKLSVVTVRLYGESICVHHTIKAGAPDLSSSPTDRWNSHIRCGMPAGNSRACRRNREAPRGWTRVRGRSGPTCEGSCVRGGSWGRLPPFRGGRRH